jgi:hypothetical protein
MTGVMVFALTLYSRMAAGNPVRKEEDGMMGHVPGGSLGLRHWSLRVSHMTLG